MAEGKVRFGLKNVHYAILTEEDGEYTYGTPVPVKGAVSLSLEPQGDMQTFYADNGAYYVTIANNGYSGDLEMALFPEQMLQEVWGDVIGTTNKVLTEFADVEPKPFALLFQVENDKDNNLYVLYNCVGTRPAIGSSTTNESKEPQTQTSSITAMPRGDGKVKAGTTSTTPTEVKSAWFTEVFDVNP